MNSTAIRRQLSEKEEAVKIRLHRLRLSLDRYASSDNNAGMIMDEIENELRREKEELQLFSVESIDPLILAQAGTREMEIEKTRVDNKIFWLEKQIYDLHVESSDEKTKLIDKVSRIRHDDLKQAIANCLEALREEKRLYDMRGISEEDASRFHYIENRLHELQTSYLQVELPH